MAVPSLTLRSVKGVPLTNTEMDDNLTNLQTAVVGISDGTTSGSLSLNDTLIFVPGTDITIGYDAGAKELTINSTAAGSPVDISNFTFTVDNLTSDGATTIAAGASSNLTLSAPGGYVIVGSNWFPTGVGTNGQVLATNAYGVLAWTTVTSTLSTATSTVLGGIKLGSGLTATADGTVSASGGGSFTGGVLTSALTVKGLNETVYNIGTTSGTVNPDVTSATIFNITLNGNWTMNALTNVTTGSNATIIVTQDATGSRTLTTATGWVFSGAAKTLSTPGGSVDMITVFYDGAKYYASLSRGFV